MKTSRPLSFTIRHIILWIFILISTTGNSQLDRFPLHQEYIEKARDKFSSLDSLAHTAMLPFEIRNPQIQENFFFTDSTNSRSGFKNKLLYDDFIKVNEEDFRVRINPLFDLSLGKDLLDTSTYADTTNFIRNTRGIKIDGQIGEKFYFHTAFLENQATLPLWQKEISDSLLVIPGLGRHKSFGETGFDFGFSQGWLSYYPLGNLNLFFGHGKQFVGHGYRSHLLSHQSFNYPHVKYTLTLLDGDLQVSWSLAALQTLERQPLGEVPESLFKRKGGSFSYINYLLGSRIQIGLFEGNIWRRFSNELGSQALAWKAYLPVPLFGAATLNDQSEQSRRIGLNAQVKLTNKTSIYGQYLFSQNGIQAGIKSNDLITNGLRVRIEYNASASSEIEDGLIDFKHFNEFLGHPASSERFQELVGIINFQKQRFVSNVTLSTITSSKNRRTINMSIGYIINPKTNTQLQVGYLHREQFETVQSGVISLGLTSYIIDSFFNY